MRIITEEEAREAAEALVTEFPDRVNTKMDLRSDGLGSGCVYYVDDPASPDCIIANILHRWGVNLAGIDSAALNPDDHGSFLRVQGITMKEEAWLFLRHLQVVADDEEVAWRVALNHTIEAWG